MLLSHLSSWAFRFVRTTIAVFAVLFPMYSFATPDAGLVLSDQIVGVTDRSFFVIRTSTLRPPSYYEYSKRVELIELSIKTGHIENRCLVRETNYTTDPNEPNTSWVQEELMPTACHPFDELFKKGANYIEAESAGPSYYTFRLREDGLSYRETESDDQESWMHLLPISEVKTRALNGSKIEVESLPWYSGENAPKMISAIIIDDEYEPLHTICTPHQFAFNALRNNWQFIRLNCWSGDDDAFGANFYVPVPGNLFGLE
ncbi:MAG: hypothetical protein ABJO09_15110 [Hyphomicrobiales bacterium]